MPSSCGSLCGTFGALHAAETSDLQVDLDLTCCGNVTKKYAADARWARGFFCLEVVENDASL